MRKSYPVLETQEYMNYGCSIVYMVTTIQLNENVKKALDRLKSNKETYEEVILNLMKEVEEYKTGREELLIEGCKEMADESLDIAKEFESIDDLSKWEW